MLTLPVWLLVLASILSVQAGSAIAATVVPQAGSATVTLIRLTIAALVLLAVSRPRLRGRSHTDWLIVIAFGLSLGWMNLTFYSAIASVPIGVAVTIEFCGPLLLAAALARRWLDAFAVLAAATGVVLISQVLQAPLASLPLGGLALAAVAGALWAAYIAASKETGQRFERLEGLAIAMTIGALGTAPFAAWNAMTGHAHLDLEVFGKGVVLALLSSVVPYSLELIALRRMPASTFGILMSLEPGVAAGLGYLFLHQQLTSWQMLGMLLVAAASAVVVGTASPQVAREVTEPEA